MPPRLLSRCRAVKVRPPRAAAIGLSTSRICRGRRSATGRSNRKSSSFSCSRRCRFATALLGAFAVADCLSEIEKQPDDRHLIRKLSTLIDEVRDFIAAICR